MRDTQDRAFPRASPGNATCLAATLRRLAGTVSYPAGPMTNTVKWWTSILTSSWRS